MSNAYSPHWKSSKNPTKQRKYRMNAPLHIKRKFLAAPLDKKLKEKYNRNAVTVRIGDKVKVMRGTHKGKKGKVDRIDVDKEKVYIVGIEREKKDGSKSMYPIHASNVLIEEVTTDDKRRFERPKKEPKSKPAKAAKKATKKTTKTKEQKQ